MDKTSKTFVGVIFALSFVVIFGLLGLLLQGPSPVVGSVAVGNQYQSTTTPKVTAGRNLCPSTSFGTGVLGSVNVLKTGAGALVLYDATTSNATLRGSIATSALTVLADFNTSPTAGSYHFDVEFKQGLLVDYTNTGTGVASTTISYRCEG